MHLPNTAAACPYAGRVHGYSASDCSRASASSRNSAHYFTAAKRLALGALAAAALLGGLAGCGKKSSNSSSAAADTSKPLDGRELGKSSQLVGTWYRTTEGEYVGFEFMKDGNVLITHALSQLTGGGMMMKYSVLDGGRLSLIAPNGQTQVFTVVLSGDDLELKGQQMLGEVAAQRFHRLKSGQTLAQAAQEERVAEQKAQQERLAALNDFFKQPKLALVNADPKMNLSRMALELTGGNGSWNGTGYVEGSTVVTTRQVQVTLQPPQGAGQPYQVYIQFGNVTGPPGMKQLPGENMTFAVKGEPKKPEIGNAARALRSDAGTFDNLVDRYKKIVAAREAAIEKFAAQFGSFTKLEGLLRQPNNANAQPRRMALGILRVEGKPAFLWADMGRDPNPPANAFNQPAGVILDGDTPYLNFGQGVGILEAVTTDGKTTLQGQIQGSNAVFEMVMTLSKDELMKRRAAVAEFLDKKLAAGVGLSGSFTNDDRPFAPIYPVHIELKSDGARNLGGTFFAHWLGARCEVTGQATDTLLGARFEVDTAKVIEDISFKLRNRGPVFSFSVQWVNGEPVFSGIQKAGGSQGNHLDLTLDSVPRMKQDRQRLEQLLAAGVTFTARTQNDTVPARPPKIQLKTEAPGGAITGISDYSSTRGSYLVPLAGKLDEQDGLLFIDLAQTKLATDVQGRFPVGKLQLWVLASEQGILLSGYLHFEGWSLETAASGRFRPPAQMAFWVDAK